MEPGAKLFVSSADLKDAFYHFELPAQLRTFFGMRSVSSDFLKLPDGHFAEGRHCRLYPQLCVLPMGWTHALRRCQTIHQKIVQDAGASRDLCLEDKAACPTGGLLHIEYVDNYVVLGSSKAAVQDLAQAGVTALRSKGLVSSMRKRALRETSKSLDGSSLELTFDLCLIGFGESVMPLTIS